MKLPTIEIKQVRDLCDKVAERSIDKGTFSRWCNRFSVPGDRASFIPIEIASSLVTFAVLHGLDARTLDGPGYRRLYPLIHRRMIELYGPSTHHDRSADPNASKTAAPRETHPEPCLAS